MPPGFSKAGRGALSAADAGGSGVRANCGSGGGSPPQAARRTRRSRWKRIGEECSSSTPRRVFETRRQLASRDSPIEFTLKLNEFLPLAIVTLIVSSSTREKESDRVRPFGDVSA